MSSAPSEERARFCFPPFRSQLSLFPCAVPIRHVFRLCAMMCTFVCTGVCVCVCVYVSERRCHLRTGSRDPLPPCIQPLQKSSHLSLLISREQLACSQGLTSGGVGWGGVSLSYRSFPVRTHTRARITLILTQQSKNAASFRRLLALKPGTNKTSHI